MRNVDGLGSICFQTEGTVDVCCFNGACSSALGPLLCPLGNILFPTVPRGSNTPLVPCDTIDMLNQIIRGWGWGVGRELSCALWDFQQHLPTRCQNTPLLQL